VKRLFGFALGIGLGAAGAYLIARAVKKARRRVPEIIVAEGVKAATSLKDAILGAIADARRAMAEAEAELRSANVRPES
jgi:hypothetical protein